MNDDIPKNETKTDMRGRIQEASIRLFNQNGYHNISMLRIAYEIGIAPGSVLYHYKKKRDLLASIFPLAESAIKTALSPQNSMTPAYSVNVYIKLFRAFWDYRFIFSDIWHSLSRDEKLHSCYLKMENDALDFLQHVHEMRVAQGDILPIQQPVTVSMLTQNHWAIWLDWLRCTVLHHPHEEEVKDEVIHEGIVRAFSLWRPYVAAEFTKNFLQRLDAALPSSKDELPPAR